MALLLLTGTGLRADDAEARATKAIEKVGGSVVRDNRIKGKPIVGVMLSFTNATDDDLKPLKDLSKVPILILIRSKVTDAGLKHLKDLDTLRELNLVSTAVTDAGLKELKDLKKLEKLNVQDTKVTAAGVADLQKALPNCKIVR